MQLKSIGVTWQQFDYTYITALSIGPRVGA